MRYSDITNMKRYGALGLFGLDGCLDCFAGGDIKTISSSSASSILTERFLLEAVAPGRIVASADAEVEPLNRLGNISLAAALFGTLKWELRVLEREEGLRGAGTSFCFALGPIQ